MADKKYYWLRLQKDFMKRHDIKIIKAMPNGKDYVIFYLTLLLESIDHQGSLRFSDTIPYSNDMLATITDTNVDIVKSAMKIFIELHMVEILDGDTIFMTEIQKMLGCETEWAEKKRTYRQSQIEDNTRTEKDNVRQEIEIEKEIDIELDIELEIENTEGKPPKLKKSKFGEYKHVSLFDEQYQNLVTDYGIDKIKEYIKKVDEYCQQYGKSYKDYNLTIRNWLNKDRTGNAPKKKEEHSYDLKEFEKLAMGNVPTFGGK